MNQKVVEMDEADQIYFVFAFLGMVQPMEVVLTDDYPPGTRALHEAFIGSNLTAYKSNQLHSPLFLKETIITFLSIVISLRAPDIQLNTVMDLDFFK